MASALSRTCTPGRHARFSTARWKGCGGCDIAVRSPPTGRRATAPAFCCRSPPRSCRARGAGSRWSSFGTMRLARASKPRARPRGSGSPGGGRCPSTATRSATRRSPRCQGSSSSCSFGLSASALTRPRRVPIAPADERSASVVRTSRRSRFAPLPTRRSARPTNSTPSTRTCATRRSKSRSRSSISASRRTRRPRGSARSRFASSATTVRSTPCAATSRGCARVSRGSETSSRRRYSTSRARTRRCSTTPSSSSRAAAATSVMPWRCSCRRRGRTTRSSSRECARSTATTPA